MGRERRKWTPDEDGILREAVELAERNSRPVEWQTVAKKLPGRTNKDCRKRWHNSLADTGNEGVWSASEDERLKNAVQIHGTKWAKVSSEVRTRNGDQCSKRWSHSVNPSLDRSQWTPEEDQALLNLIDHYGHNWQAIVSQHLPHRSALSAKNRHFLLNRKSNSKSVSKSPSRKDKTSQRPSNITLTASSGNASNWVASSSPSAQTTTYATPTTRSLPFYSSPTQVGAIPTSSPPLYSDPPLGYGSPSTFGTGTHLPSNLDLHGRFFNSPDLLSPSYSPRAPSLRTPPFNTVGSSSISPDPVLPSYTGSFAQPSSYSLSSQSSTYPFPTVSSNASSNEMYYSYLQSTSSAAPYSATANAYTTTSSTYPGAIAYTSPHTSYSWPTAHQDEINAGNFINDDEAEEDEDEEGGGDSSEGLEESDPEGVQRIWVEAECERGQVESLMQSVHAYSRSATFMPRPGQ